MNACTFADTPSDLPLCGQCGLFPQHPPPPRGYQPRSRLLRVGVLIGSFCVVQHIAHLVHNATPRSAVPNVSPCVLPVITIRMEPSLAQSEARRFYTPTHTRDVANLCPFLLQLPHDDLSFRLQAHTVTHRLTPHTVVSHSADERLVESNIGLPYINLSFI